jgi:hypothetical protein
MNLEKMTKRTKIKMLARRVKLSKRKALQEANLWKTLKKSFYTLLKESMADMVLF